LSSTEGIIKRILALKPNLTREAVEALIEEERAKAAGLLTEEAAAHLVASNLGIDGAGQRIEAKLKVGGLTSGLSDVSLTGRVIHVFKPHTFSRDDGRQGKVLRMILGDSTGSVTVVFWDDKADHVEASKITPGKIVRVLHGYSRERRGDVEVNMGSRGQVFMEPMDAVEANFPPVESFFKTPSDVHGEGTFHLEGVVVDSFPASTFTRQDGSEGKVSRLLLEEGGGRINLVLWDDKVTELGDTNRGTRLRIVSGSSRKRANGAPEIHISYSTEVMTLEEGVEPTEPVPYWTKIGDLREGGGSVNVVTKVSQVGEPRSFVRRDGGEGRVVNVLVGDDTGTVRLSLWDDDVDLAAEMKPGDVLVVKNGYTRSGFGGVELSSGRSGRVTLNPEDLDVDVEAIEPKITEIIDLREGQRNVTVQGQLLDDPIQRDIDTSRGPATVTNFRIDDDTGEARVSLWRDLAEEAMDLTAGAEVRIENLNMREPFDGLIQVSSGTFTKITVLKK